MTLTTLEKQVTKKTKKTKKIDDFYIIGIGSSAGGLKALEEFFDNCPSNTGFAFVIIQHLSPDYKSLMPELLSRHTEMSVKEAKEGDEVKPNHVYLIPGTKNLQISKGKLDLTARPPSNQINFSIDLFFSSLAIEKKEKSLAIILSGTGTDGTKGAKAIKEIGGTIFVQNPESSDFDGMPRSAISQGLADYILTPREMGRELVDFASHPNSLFPINSGTLENNDEFLQRILKVIKTKVGYDFFSYKKPTLLRRTAKRISITKCKNAETYIDYLHTHSEEKFLLTQEFLIGVTKFFRDHKAFEIIERDVIPGILERKKKGDTIKIWTVACSTGEEAYSLTIMLDQYLKKNKIDVDYKVFATDLDETAIEIAAKGVYNQNIESEVSKEILGQYFIKKDSKYRIHPSIRKNIIFSKHDILQNPPFNKMDLVSCRNMLIYMENNIQTKVLFSLHYALNLHGYLFLGSSENLGLLSKNFKEISSKWKIYENVQAERILNLNKSNVWRVEREGSSRFQSRRSGTSFEDKIAKSINKVLMDELDAVSICVDENYDIIYATGKFKQYLEYPEEGFSNNLLKIIPDELNIPISTSVRKLMTTRGETIEKRIRLRINNSLKKIRLLISSFNIISTHNKAYLITIVEEGQRKLTENDFVNVTSLVSENEQLEELKEALGETRENLQSTIEELETSNEEMQATNEELLASNEELQSTNEELQSLNEELHTVNAELQEKNAELIELNSDVENLMQNINIGTIFLDRDFQIRKFTPSISDHFQLRTDDTGRSISHFSGTLGGEDVIKYSKQVIKKLTPLKKEVKNTKGEWFSMQIFPYRSQEDLIQGVVVNFINIHEAKKLIKEKDEANAFLTHLTDSNPAIIYIYDLERKKNTYSSANVAQIAGYTEFEIKKMGNELMQKIIHPDDLVRITKYHESLKLLKDDDSKQIEYRIVTKNEQIIWVLSTDKVHEKDNNDNVKTILGVALITTDSKKMETQLKQSEERFRLAVTGTGSGLWEWSDLTKDEAWLSDQLYHLLGYTKKELKPSFSTLINLIHPEQLKLFRKGLEIHVGKETPFEEEILIKTKNEGYKWFRINAQKQTDEYQIASKIVGTILDIHERKNSETKLQDLNVELERFAYLASHDLKEPLNTLISFTMLLQEEYKDKLDDNAKLYIDFIQNASARMTTLTNDLLQYSQLDNKSLNFDNLSLIKLIDEVKEDLQNQITTSKAEIIVNKELPEVVCDKIQMKQLLQNLLSNSLKYKGDNVPKIKIDFNEKISYFEILIKDNGIGIAKKHHTQIFEVFKRLHNQEEYEGTGIGLANCKRIIDNHGGRIWVKSKKGAGAEFVFTIPKKLD